MTHFPLRLLHANEPNRTKRNMKTTTGSLIKRGRNFYCFWRSKGKAFCKVLRDESGQPITHKTDAERAKAKLMEFFGRRNQVESLRSIQHAIDDTNADIAAREDAQHPALPLSQTWTAFVQSNERHDCSKATLQQYESKWEIFREWVNREYPGVLTLRDVSSQIADGFL